MRKINLGCGRLKLPDYINVDRNSACNPDIVHDLSKGLPFDSDSADEIAAYDFLEHCEDFVSVMNEIIRVLKVGGKLITRFPPWNREGAFSAAHARVVVYSDFKAFERDGSRDFMHSIKGERLVKKLKVLKAETIKGKCPYCPEGSHKLPKCHVIAEKVE